LFVSFVYEFAIDGREGVPASMAKSPPRRTQEERSEETKRALQEATIRLLQEKGYSRFTTLDAARAVGVSRGALTHHFANKEDLVLRSIEFQLEGVTSDLRRFVDDGTGRVQTTDEIADFLWRMMSGGLFYVTMEYLPEARHNAEFRRRLLPVVRQFHGALDDIWMRLSEANGLTWNQAKVILNATMCVMRGMIAQTVLRRDPAYYNEILVYWKDHLRREIAEARRTAIKKSRKAR
jgi:AcrR family transcriptional regulator